MDFDKIKKQMDTNSLSDSQIPKSLKELKKSNMPIQKVRKSMKSEIITQLVIMVIFFSVPILVKFHPLAKGIYYILMSITSLITLIYLGKMIWFVNKKSDISNPSKDAVVSFIHDLKLTLEVYKTAIISGSLLLPFSVICMYLGNSKMDKELFENLISLNMSNSSLALYALGYLILAIIIYFGTIVWSDKLYGVHIKDLEQILEELND